jgi:hypothetical protein
MDRREFIKKTLSVGTVIATAGALIAISAPERPYYIMGIDPITGKGTTAKVVVFRYGDKILWKHEDELERERQTAELFKDGFNSMFLYGEEIYEINYG